MTAPAIPWAGNAPPPAQATDATLSSFQRIGFASLVVYIVLMVGRVPEILSLTIGTSFYQIFVVSIACLVFTMVGGGLGRVLRSKLALVIIAMHVWFLIGVPFSYWWGGTADAVVTVAKMMPGFFFASALLLTISQLRKVMLAFVLAMLIDLVWILSSTAVSNDERFSLTSSRFANSNEIATFLLIGLPFWLYLVVSKRTSKIVRVLAVAEMAVTLVACLRTGSRGGLITIGFILLLIFLAADAGNKVKLIVISLLMVLIVVPFVPESIRLRLMSLSLSSTDGVNDSSAIASSESRYALLTESISVAIEHPVFGVGLGVYAAAAAKRAEAQGRRAKWQVSHNSYAEVAAETGFPALILYITSLVIAVRELRICRKLARSFPAMEDLHLTASCILLSLIVFILNGLFANLATEFFYYLLLGVTLAASTIIKAEYNRQVALQTQGFRSEAQKEIAAARPKAELVSASQANRYGNVPWARNPRKNPPRPGTPAR